MLKLKTHSGCHELFNFQYMTNMTNNTIHSNMTSFRFANKRASYPFGIISLAHAPVNVTDFSIGSINCDVSIYSENRRGIYFSPQKPLKHGRQNITLHWINGIIRNNKCIFTKPLIQWSVMFCRPCFNGFWGLKYIPRLFSEYMLTCRVEEPMKICVTN
jgi:hypothetical protein